MKAVSSGVIAFVLCLTFQSKAQTAGARFLLLRPSASANAMGGIGVATTEDGFATYFNPAGLAFSRGLNISGSFVKPLPFFGDIVHSYGAASFNFVSIGAIGVSGNFYWRGRQFRLNQNAVRAGVLDNYLNYNAKASYATRITENVAVGGSVGIVRQKLEDFGDHSGQITTNSVMFDLGVQIKGVATDLVWTPEVGIEDESGIGELASTDEHRGASFGFAIVNFGPKMTFIDEEQADKPPTLVTTGFAYSPIRSREVGVMIAFEVEKRFFEESFIDYMHYGTEVTLYRFFALRVGRYADTFGANNSYWTWGGGLRTKFFSLSIASYSQSIVRAWHFDGQFHWEF
jgi:hypothetical protein